VILYDHDDGQFKVALVFSCARGTCSDHIDDFLPGFPHIDSQNADHDYKLSDKLRCKIGRKKDITANVLTSDNDAK